MLTTPITTPLFHTRVLTLLSTYMDQAKGMEAIPIIPPLSPVDTPLAPGETLSQLIGVVSPWIDLCSPDPAIYGLSRQVLDLEIAYAAFCGLGNIILPTPKLHHGRSHGEGVTQYAYAIQEALQIGHYIYMSVTMPMMDNPHQESNDLIGSLADKARARYTGLSEENHHKASVERDEKDEEGTVLVTRKSFAEFDFFGSWDAWHIIRTVCKYNTRLCVGKNWTSIFLNISFRPIFYFQCNVLLCSELRRFRDMAREVLFLSSFSHVFLLVHLTDWRHGSQPCVYHRTSRQKVSNQDGYLSPYDCLF